MSKDPAFLFYSSDFLTGTMFMSAEQAGIYIRLLCAQHQHGGLIGKADFDAMVGIDPVIRAKFIETAEGYYNERLREESEKRALYSESRRNNRLSKPCEEHKNDISSSYDERMENENEDINVIKVEDKEKDKREASGRFLEKHLLDQWGQKEGRLNALRMQELIAHARKHGWQKVFEVIEQAGRRNACNVAYVTACLEPKDKDAIAAVEAAKKREAFLKERGIDPTYDPALERKK
jgi:uncharacterized protein YdaU (DUF1376 family)